MLKNILCHQEERIVGRENSVRVSGLVLQIPESPARSHFVKARVRVHRYPDGDQSRQLHHAMGQDRYDME